MLVRGSSQARLTVGFLLAACMPGLVWASATALYELNTTDLFTFLSELVTLVGFSLLVTGPATVLFGIPAYLFYQGRGWKSWWSYGLGGALIGWGFAVLFTILILPSLHFSFSILLLGAADAVFGAVSALTLWLSLYARARVLPMMFGLFCLGLLVIGLFGYLAA